MPDPGLYPAHTHTVAFLQVENAHQIHLVGGDRTQRRGLDVNAGATVARHYTDSLPFLPPMIDRDRKRTYAMLLSSFLS